MNLPNDSRRGLLSASAFERAAECPGSVAMENEIVATGCHYELPDAARKSGIQIHSWNALEALGDDPARIELTADERVTAKHCAELRNVGLAAWESRQPNAKGNAELFIEKRFWYRRGFVPLFSGQPDFVKINPAARRAFIINYKTGRLEAEEAADNLQLRAEVVLIKHNFPLLEEISAAIIEPFVSWDSVQVRYSGDGLRQAENQIVAIADRTTWEADRRVPGLHCKYCKARSYCREAIQYAQGIKQMDPETAVAELPRGEAGSRLWERIKVAKKLLEGLEWAYTRIMETDPDALPGYVLPEKGKARRRVPFPRQLKEALGEYLSPDEIDGCADYRLGKIEELLGIKHKIADEELKPLFQKLTKDVVTLTYDEAFIRALTKRERETARKSEALTRK